MSTLLGKFAILDGEIVPVEKATLPVASSAVLYGLSVYTVFFGKDNRSIVRDCLIPLKSLG
jgi:branched-subunit amino acid aminotransferase/4-amino-4-deoxychorismate lyase